MSDAPFWQTKYLHEMSVDEWESLCDGCGKCCLQKVIDDDAGLIYYTSVACAYLDIKSCQCNVYSQRQLHVPDCTKITPDNVAHFDWLPETCAYRLVAQNEPLPNWHPLITGDKKSPTKAGMTVKKWAVSERKVAQENWGAHIIDIVLLDTD